MNQERRTRNEEPRRKAPVAVIDIGSNTIKLLVARKKKGCHSRLDTIHRNTLETRIGQGMNAREARFSPEVIARAADAVARLVEEARSFSPDAIRIVATSAARDARNRDELVEAVRAQTGLPLEVLSGWREGELIGGAVRLDPRITARDFYVFDLGGGSLECLRFMDRRLDEVASLPLGCVRLSEKLLADPAAIFTEEHEQRIATEVKRVLTESGFAFSLPPGAIAIGTGGTLTTALDITAARRRKKLAELPPYLSKSDLRALLALVGNLPLPERLQVERLSPGRADVFPAALATFLTLAELTGQEGLHHSLLNLRYGLAAEMLDG